MRGLNECLSAFSSLLSGLDKNQRRCCLSNYLSDLEFHETRHMDDRDLLWVYMNISCEMVLFDIFYN
jgi:hypothetical protein